MTSAIDLQSTQINKPVLRRGSRGEAVRELQTLLYNYGAYEIICENGPSSAYVDGIFGPTTERAVKAFQYQVFLLEDGIVGNQTWRALYKGAPVDMPILQLGSKGELVKKVQGRLYHATYSGPVDGNFGSSTKVAVEALQRTTGLPVDGKVGDRTWFELSKIRYFECV